MFSPPAPRSLPIFGGRRALGSWSGFVMVSHGPGSSLGGHCSLSRAGQLLVTNTLHRCSSQSAVFRQTLKLVLTYSDTGWETARLALLHFSLNCPSGKDLLWGQILVRCGARCISMSIGLLF